VRASALAAALALVPAAPAAQLPPATPAGQLVFYGHIKSLRPNGGGYRLRLDPALLLEGTTAHAAAVADLPGGTPQIDAFYARDESHALLTFVVPRSARATVITMRPDNGVRSTRVGVAELARLIRGENPRHRALLASPLAFGFWVRVDIDQVRSLDAQYRP
jgi:hypothetical protein